MSFEKLFNGMIGGMAALVLGAPADAQISSQQSLIIRGFDMARIPDYARCEALIMIQSMPKDARLSLEEYSVSDGIDYVFKVDAGNNDKPGENSQLRMGWNDKGFEEKNFQLRYQHSETYGDANIYHADVTTFFKVGSSLPRSRENPASWNNTSMSRNSVLVADLPKRASYSKAMFDRMRAGCEPLIG